MGWDRYSKYNKVECNIQEGAFLEYKLKAENQLRDIVMVMDIHVYVIWSGQIKAIVCFSMIHCDI